MYVQAKLISTYRQISQFEITRNHYRCEYIAGYFPDLPGTDFAGFTGARTAGWTLGTGGFETDCGTGFLPLDTLFDPFDEAAAVKDVGLPAFGLDKVDPLPTAIGSAPESFFGVTLGPPTDSGNGPDANVENPDSFFGAGALAVSGFWPPTDSGNDPDPNIENADSFLGDGTLGS